MTSQHQPSRNTSKDSATVRELIAATRSTPGLSSDEEAVFRFIQGMSTEKKELLALGFINEMSKETREELEREILEDMEQAQVKTTSNTAEKKSPISLLRSTANKIFFSSKKKTTASKAA
eukprot:CAMPEP_0117005134 /NCGR_PEP_ID=MMETSP0472-20121206/5864_1 /TAXON_ID=693140 ORGANISM="Tiarina fusus, Strain LIS" /NCGR_SAMPLE_ID=MMETSP0472 /ASSEMBLY_ACC=CAM_ASM_000603 /LENGTH=119 /DNA_ID=CAMNT_0004706299 /DNA_START=50 /DNA_END=409 /DNA_ORIENTATION=+